MNRNLFRVVFSRVRQQRVVVGENTTSCGKAASGDTALSTPASGTLASGGKVQVFTIAGLAAALMGLHTPLWANTIDANALPTGEAVQAGSATHSVDGSTMNIVQGTSRAVVNYNSFNIGSNATVNHSGGVLLGRVTGGTASRIEGTLNTSGMVLVNPNGIAIGSTANINAGSFTASTFNISNDDFMAGRLRFERNGTEAGVVNEGTITTEGGGYVALVGATVDNHGRITTAGGDVVMASGQAATISVPLSGSGRVRLELDAGTLNAAVANHANGVIITEGGQVLMRAAALVDATSGSNMAPATVTHMGQVDTTGEQGGRVDILADNGIVRVGGSITANSTGNNPDGSPKAGGDIFIGRDEDTNVLAAVGDASGASLESQGGFVETSGAFLKTTGTRVRAKDWLLDPTDISIVETDTVVENTSKTSTTGLDTYQQAGAINASEILTSDIVDALSVGTNVLIRTTSGGSGHGDITVASNITVAGNADATLTLQAERNIVLNQGVSISRSGSNRLHVVLNSDFDENGAGAVILNLGSSIVTNGGNLSIGGGLAGNASGYAQGYAGQLYGVSINGATLNTGLGDIVIRGRSNQSGGAGVYIRNTTTILSANQHTSTPTLVNGRNVTIDGVSQVGAGLNATGVLFDIYSGGTTTNGSVRIDASADLNVLGHLGGGGTGSAIRVANTWTGVDAGAALLLNAGGSGTLHGVQTGNTANTESAIRLTGFRLNTVGDARILAEAANSNSIAIGLIRTDGTLRLFSDSWRMQVRSSAGDVRIQSNQGAILGMDTGGGVNISGRHVIIDNTGAGMTVAGVANANGGSINSSTGEIVLGSGTSTFTTSQTNGWAGSWVPLGVSLGNVGNSLAGVTATDRLTIGSSSNSGNGINVFSARTVAGNIHLAGRTSLADAHGVNIGAALTSTNGNIALTGSATTGNGILIGSSLTANSGTVRLTGAVSSSSASTPPNAGVRVAASINANTIDIEAINTATTGNAIGYYGGVTANLTASQTLSVVGHSVNHGIYAFGGSFTAGTGLTVQGTSLVADAVAFDKAGDTGSLFTLSNSMGGVSIAGHSNDSTKNAILLNGVSMTNGGGGLSLTSTSGHIQVASTFTGASNTLTQAGTGHLVLQTLGTGNITVPVIVNNGTGNVVVAAGSNLAAGTSTGGQVLTVSGNTITQNSTGKTYIYSGSVADTGNLSFIGTGLGTLYYQGASNPLNTQFGVAYGDGTHSGALTNGLQVRFREALGAANQFEIDLASQTKIYGDTDPALKLSDNSTLPTTITRVLGSNTLAIATADLGIGRVSGANVGEYNYTVASGMNASLGGAKLTIAPRDITIDTIDVTSREYDGTTTATFTGATFNNVVAGETLLLSGTGVFDDPNVDDVNEVTSIDFGSLTKTNGTGSWSNYNLLTTFTAQTAVGKITLRPLTATALNQTVVFNNQLQTQTVQVVGLIAGEDVQLTGAASGVQPGTYRSALQATGLGLRNYALTLNNADFVISGARPNRPSRIDSLSPKDPVIPVGENGASSQGSASMSTSSNPFQLASTDLPDLMDPKCNLEDLTNCRCDPLQPADMQRASVGLEAAQVCYQPVN